MTSCYLPGLNASIRDNIRVVHLFNLEDAWQYTLMMRKKLLHQGSRKPIVVHFDTMLHKNIVVVQGVQSDQTTKKNEKTTITSRRRPL